MQVEWRLLQQLPRLSLREVNDSLHALVAGKQGSLALYKEIAARCAQLCRTSENNEVERTLTLFTGVTSELREIGDVYTAALPKVKLMIGGLPAERVAGLVLAYASSGLADPPFYHHSNSLLKPHIHSLPADVCVRLAHWLSPHLSSLPEADTIYPALEALPRLSPALTTTLLQGFIGAKKGSVEFFQRCAEVVTAGKSELEERLQAAAIHFLCRGGLQDGRLTQKLEDMAADFSEVSLVVAAAFDLVSLHYRPRRLLRVISERAGEMTDARDALCVQWVYESLREEMPATLQRTCLFLMLRSTRVNDFFLSKRLSAQLRAGK